MKKIFFLLGLFSLTFVQGFCHEWHPLRVEGEKVYATPEQIQISNQGIHFCYQDQIFL